MDVIAAIKKEHDLVKALFARFRAGGGVAGLVKRVTGRVTSRQRRSAARDVCRELATHARLEEEVFYPALHAVGDVDLRRLVDEAMQGHERVKMQVEAVRIGKMEDDELDDLMRYLEQDVEEHVGAEERYMLPRVERLIPVGERVRLGRRMEAHRSAGNGDDAPARWARRSGSRAR